LIGTEFKGDEHTPDGTTAVFHLDGGLMLSIYPRSELAKDAIVPLTPAKSGEFSIGHVVASRAEVDEIICRPNEPERRSPTGLTTARGVSTRDTSAIPTTTSGRFCGTPPLTSTHPSSNGRHDIKSAIGDVGDQRSVLGKSSKITLGVPVPRHSCYRTPPPALHLLQGTPMRFIAA
jgi:hypothetical protein